MKNSFITKLIPVLLGLLATGLIYYLVSTDTAIKLTQRLPRADNVPEELLADEGEIKIEGHFELFDGIASTLRGKWPNFRGENFDAISKEDITLKKSWAAEEPEIIWNIDVGEGYAGAAVLNGRVYVLDYDRDRQADTIRCLSFDDGKDIWRYWYPIKVKRNHGMSRTVPAVTEKHIVTIGPKCHVTCLDSVTGEFKWMINLVREYGTEVPLWYTGQCPLIDNGKAIIAPGGNALMIAVDCNSGEIVWETENLKKWKMTHSSIIPIEFEGMRMYVYCGSGGVVGVSAKDGKVLWQTTDWKIRTNIPSPIYAGDGLIFLSGGYNKGSMMIRLINDSGKIKVKKIFQLKPEVFGSPQHTPVFYQDYIYGVRPDEQLVCLDLNGNVIWNSSSAHKFGLGPYMIADGLIFLMNDTGVLTTAKASPNGYTQLAQAKVLDGHDSWGPMALASGRLILRDLNKMICIDVSKH